jgi:hypothetical protein
MLICWNTIPIKKILEKIPINDHFSCFYSEKTQTRDHFSEKFFIGHGFILPSLLIEWLNYFIL